MNNKVYRLLRNNKEQGPFTAEELIQKSLKPFDLIWADGRSAAWNYPTELPEFKMYVPDTAEMMVANNLKISAEIKISAPFQAAVSINEAINKNESSKQKPRYKVSAAWSKIQTIVPVNKDVIAVQPKKTLSSKIIDLSNIQPANVKSLSWEQAWLDWEHEKNSIAPPKSLTAQSNIVFEQIKVKQEKTEPVLEKKFEQSLDTITNNYIDSLLQQKKKLKNINLGKASEFVLPSLALIIIFSIAYWFMHDTKVAAVPDSLPINNQAAVPVKKIEQPNIVKTTPAKISQVILTQKSVHNTNGNITPNETPVKEPPTQPNTSVAKFIEPIKTADANNITGNSIHQSSPASIVNVDLTKTKQSSKQFDPSVINNVPKNNTYNDASTSNNNDANAAENRPVKRRTNITETANQNINQVNNTASSNKNSGVNYVSAPEYIAMNDGIGNLKIQNISDVDLELAVVDVQYYDASGRFRKGETLYLHNLRAGKSVIIKTAKDTDAAYATSKVSLVSSDANGVYAVGDN